MFGLQIVNSREQRAKTDRILILDGKIEEINEKMIAFDRQSEGQTSAQILVFSQMESRLELLEALHGVKFEPYDINDLTKAGSGRHVKADGRTIQILIRKLTKAWRAIQKEKDYYKKIGIKK